MTITVAKLKRALEETIAQDEAWNTQALLAIMSSPTTLTILAEKLSERPARVTPEAQQRPQKPPRRVFAKGERVSYTYAVNPFRHKVGTVIEQTVEGVTVQWDSYARPTRVASTMIEPER